MQNHIIFITHGSAVVYILTSLLLFANLKEGDRSRAILAGIQLYSGVAFALGFILLYKGETSSQVISIVTLISSFIVTISYLIYSIEVISPKWLNLRRVATLCAPIFVIICIYLISLWAGVKYIQYNSIMEMIPNITHFEVWFRFVLCLLLFTPVFYIFFVPYSKKYNNTNVVWMHTYVILITLNTLSYLLGMLFADALFYIVCYYISSVSRLTIVYIELFVRLNGRYVSKNIVDEKSMEKSMDRTVTLIDKEQIKEEEIEVDTLGTENILKSKTLTLFEQLDEYMHKNYAWRDPDLSMTKLVDILKTNRTTLAQAIQEHGRENYGVYINKLRIEDFIQSIKNRTGQSFKETFYDVGFRSRNTALRGFRRVTGTIPSEYFHNLDDNQ